MYWQDFVYYGMVLAVIGALVCFFWMLGVEYPKKFKEHNEKICVSYFECVKKSSSEDCIKWIDEDIRHCLKDVETNE